VGKRVVITCWGSHGDLFPYIGLGVALKTRGHRPVVATMPMYRANVEREGLEFAPAGPDVDVTDLDLFARLMDPVRGTETIVRDLLMPALRHSYDELRAAVGGADLLVSHPITYAAPVLAEHARLPWVSTVLAPMLFFSAYEPIVLPSAPRLNAVPLVGNWLARTILRIARGPMQKWVQPVHDLRAKLGLPRGRHPLFEGQFSPYGTLALHSRVLAAPQRDWPANVWVTGSVLYNEPDPLEPSLEEFLAAGEPPVVFTLGTSAVGAAGRFYHESVAAAVELGVRAVLLTGGLAQNRPEHAPPNVLLVDRAAHQLLFPRASAIVHQVGAGTTAQALRSGRPTLLVPHGHDQFDNAYRVQRLGVARTLFPQQYRAARVARELSVLLNDRGYRERAAATADTVRQERGAEAAAEAIEQALAEAR
jgi:UDP:flavonoid glycosyltransferase YjiC (YdhE family)